MKSSLFPNKTAIFPRQGFVLQGPSRRVVLVVLPDQFDLSRWYHLCNEAGNRTYHAVGDELGQGAWRGAELTYPQLRYVSGVFYIYLGWRGQLHSRHLATQTRILRTTDLPDSQYYPEWRERYRVGEWYHWRLAALNPVSQYPLPSNIMQSPGWNMWMPIMGTISDLAQIDEEPHWSGMGYEAMYNPEQGLP